MPRRSARCWHEPAGPPNRTGRGALDRARDLHGKPRAAHRGGADLRDRPDRCDWRRHRRAQTRPAPRQSRAQGDRAARPLRAGSRAPLRTPVAHELRHRLRRLPARLLHHEAQPAAQRENGAVAGFRRHPSAPAAVDGARRARPDRGAFALAVRAHRHAGGRAHAEGRRARRALRHDGDQGGAHRSRREAVDRAGAGVRRTARIRRPPRCSVIASNPSRREPTAQSIPRR